MARSRWWKDTPETDPERVGITFVDLLFALVVGEILTPLQRWWTIPATGWSHLAVAFVLTVGSWIGYHTSTNKPGYAIKFVNWPLAQFGLDVAMVIAYWMTAATAPLAEHAPGLNLAAPTASAVSESALVLASFILYVAWDRVSKIIQSKDYYIHSQERPWDHGRRVVTVVCAGVAALITVAAVVVQHKRPGDAAWIIGLDVALIVLLLGYRAAKELWRLWKRSRLEPAPVEASSTPTTAPPVKPPDILGRLASIETKIDQLQRTE